MDAMQWSDASNDLEQMASSNSISLHHNKRPGNIESSIEDCGFVASSVQSNIFFVLNDSHLLEILMCSRSSSDPVEELGSLFF